MASKKDRLFEQCRMTYRDCSAANHSPIIISEGIGFLQGMYCTLTTLGMHPDLAEQCHKWMMLLDEKRRIQS